MPDSTLPDWPGWERRSITVQLFRAPVTVAALVRGHLAVHPTPPDGRTWSVTHVPSGYALAVWLPRPTDARRVARIAARTTIDWSQPLSWFSESAFDPAYVAAVAPVRVAIRRGWRGKAG